MKQTITNTTGITISNDSTNKKMKNKFSNKFIKSILTTVVLALSTMLAFAQSAGFNGSYLILSANAAADTYYDLNAVTTNPDFQGSNLGTFVLGANSLTLKGAEHNVYKCDGCDISATSMNYRIYSTTGAAGSFISVNVPYFSGFNNGCGGGADQQWKTTSANVNVLNGLGAGTYFLEVYEMATTTCTNQFLSNFGANYKAQFTVACPTVTIAAASATSFCSGGSVSLSTSAIEGATYQWKLAGTNIGPNAASYTVNQSGIFSLTVTTSLGCVINSNTIPVTVNSNPTVAVTSSSLESTCGSPVTSTASGASTYLWSNGGTSATGSFTSAGTYTVTGASSAGCTGTATVTVTSSSSTTSNAVTVQYYTLPTASVSGTATVCQNGTSPSITFTAANGTAPYTFTYKINGGSNLTVSTTGINLSANVSASTTTAGTLTYTLVSVADANCSQDQAGTAVITVNPTPAISAMTPSLCSGSSFSVTPANGTNGTVPSGTTYTWAAPTTANIQGLLAGSAASSISGTLFNTTNAAINAVYTVTPTAPTGSCAGTPFTVTVTVNALPVVSVNASNTNLCAGDVVTLSGQGANTYAWSNGVSNGVAFTPATTTYYSVTGANTSTGCSNTGGALITVNAAPTALTITGTNCLPNSNSTGTVTSSNSVSGVNYQLYNADGIVDVPSQVGTGGGLLWSDVPVGNGYYVVSSIGESCQVNSNSVGVTSTQGNTPYVYYADVDNDGFASNIPISSCNPLTGYATVAGGDCNDNNAAIKPGVADICGDGIDNDCSGTDAFASMYRSVTSGDWSSPSTWSISCDNSSWSSAILAPTGDSYSTANPYLITVQGHTVTVSTTSTTNCGKAGSLTINSGGTVIVNGKLTVVNAFVNSGTLTINNGGSFVQNSTTTANSGNGVFNVNMTLAGSTNAAGTAANGRYWFIGSPMNNTVAGTFYDVQGLARLWRYNGSNNSWPSVVSTTLSSNNNLKLVPGIGYLFRAGVSTSFTFTGVTSNFNNNITSSLLSPTGSGYLPVAGYDDRIGFKFVSNPYPSHVDWHLVTRTGLNVSYWIRTADNTNYESYNLSSGLSTNNISGQTNRFIPPMQGFYVYSFNTTPTLRVDNTDRVHSGNVLHSPVYNQVVRLNLNDGKTTDETVVYENENASNGLEDYDTYKMFDNQHHQLYFMEGIKELSMDGLKDATAKQKVDMGIQITGAGTYTINATELGVEEDVVLEDKFTHTFQDMKLNNTYSFTANAGTFNNRFVLHFTLTPSTETAIETETVTVGETVGESEGVQVYTTTGQQVKVWVTNTAEFQNATVKVYDAIGNLIERKNMTSSELLLDLNTATGVYLVEVTGANKTFTKKVFITK